ncbi:MAG: von Willebrand factor type A domain-containing protein [Lentisphaerae bacterium]|nr:von Willebrand factor type A domain-containing protein [Lentisphaerota bacterium]
MNCNDYSKLMTDLLAGEISGKDKAVIDSHLASCESCRKEFEELKTVWTLTESALKEDFFDDSLKPDQYQKIFNSVKPEILPVPSKKSTPIKFMWLEIAASITVCVILAALLLPSLSLSRVNARQFSKSNQMHQEKLGTVTGNWHPIVTPKDVFIPQEDKLAEDKSEVNKNRMSAKEISEGEIARGGELLQKGQSQKSDRLEERAAGKDAKDSETNAPSVVMFPTYGLESGMAGAIAPVSTATEEKQEAADKSLEADYRYSDNLMVAVAPAASPAPAITAAPAEAAKPEPPLTPIFARKSLKDEDLKRDETSDDYKKPAESKVAVSTAATPRDSGKQLAYDRVDSLKESNEGLKSKAVIGKEEVRGISLTYKIYSLNLKLWDLTDEKTAREFLKRKGANFADSAEISINRDSNTITITTTKENLEKADELFSELRRSEDSLKEMKDGIPFLPTKQKPFSTFSIDVDTASYTMARKLLRNGQKPDSFSVRPEEFINYFDYHYRSPSNSTFAVYLESAPSAFRPENYTLRVGVKARELGPDGSRPSVFTIVIDASGSMARENRMDLVKKTLPLLFDQMKPDDKVAVFVCTHRVVNIVDYLPVKEKKTIIKLVEGIMPAGVADIENGLVTAYDSASRHYVSGAYNRVILLTDGISNIGTHSAEAILAKVSFARNMGITNTVIALGGDGDDKFLETVANKGDGNYVYIENEEGARELFVNEFAGRFREIARDVKIQVEFNPMIVSQYRQVGYQNRQLSKADFRNDKVDAGEVGAGQSVTALYEMKLNKAFPSKSSDTAIDNPINYSICIVRLRYRRADNMDMEEKEFPLAFHELKFNSDKASCGFRLAAAVAEFAEFLRYPDVPGIANPENIMKQIQGVIGEDYRNDGKVSELYSLVKNVK